MNIIPCKCIPESHLAVSYCHDRNTPPHTHEFLELAYIVSGEAIHTCDGVSTHIHTGDYFIIDYNSIHSYEAVGDGDFFVINCLFLPTIIDRTLVQCRSFIEMIDSCFTRFTSKSLINLPTRYTFHDDTGEIRQIVSNIDNEYSARAPGYTEIIRGELMRLLIYSMRKLRKENFSEDIPEVIYEIIKYTEENYASPLSLSEVAKKTHYSLPYLSALFKSCIGMTYSEYLQKIRISRALILLTQTDLKINEISAKCGYGDIKFFGEVFKRKTGLSPREYRRTAGVIR